eukprot:SAG25_NODE_862_length_5023_cov_2.854010_4_plen_129_part_00
MIAPPPPPSSEGGGGDGGGGGGGGVDAHDGVEHEEAGVLGILPVGQGKHELELVAPVAELYVFLGQISQDLVPKNELYWPCTQSKHELPPYSLYLPSGQSAHELEPRVLNCPGRHLVQAKSVWELEYW